MIAIAERSLYIENQFLTSVAIAQALAQQMRKKPELEAVIVAPHTPTGWLEAHTMRKTAGFVSCTSCVTPASGERVRLLYPEVRDGPHVPHTMVHSKVMIVDDRLLRVGSANMNNRSMAPTPNATSRSKRLRRAAQAIGRSARACWRSLRCARGRAAQAVEAARLSAPPDAIAPGSSAACDR